MSAAPLYINRDVDYDWLIALEFGRVLDGQSEDYMQQVGEDFVFVLDHPLGRIVGFAVTELSAFDPEDHLELWAAPLFDAPVFGLRAVPAGAVVLAAKARLLEESTVNRAFFDAATGTKGDEAVALWRQCLESGDSMAHYALGYTLLELGRARDAYGHLREYTELCPWNAWAWCFLGQACQALGELTDAPRRTAAPCSSIPKRPTRPDLLEALEDGA